MPSKSSAKQQSSAALPDDDDDVLQAVVLADSFNRRFRPLTSHKPRCLLPICNASLLEWTFESLVLAGVSDIFVVCRSHADLVKEAIEKSKYNSPRSGVTITPIITAKETFAPGDALRDIYTHGVITSDFVLVSGDLVSSVKIDEAVKAHKERRKTNKDAIMTMVVKESGASHRTRPNGDTGLFVLDPSTSECLHYEPVLAQPAKRRTSIPREIFQAHPEVEIRNDLIDCSIDICSVEVPSLFQDNFDYLDVRRDFVHGILTSDLLNRNIFCHVLRQGYATRVKDTKTYDAVAKDILSRWTFPLVPDGNYPGDDAYEHLPVNKYIAAGNTVVLSRTSKIGNNTLIGASTRIHEQVQIQSSTIGRQVVIRKSTSITGSHIFDGCDIGANCVIEHCIIGENVRILANTTLKRGCRLGNGVVVGPNVTLEEFSRVSTRPFRLDDDEDSEDEVEDVLTPQSSDQSALGAQGVGYLWPAESPEEDEGDEVEAFENQQYLRIGSARATPLLSKEGEDESESDNSELDSESGTGAALGRITSRSSATSLPEEPAGEAEFLSECVQSLQRAFIEGHSVENAAVELKTLRMASNVPLRRVREVVIGFLVDKIPLDKDLASQKRELLQIIKRWGSLVLAIGGANGVETVSILEEHCAAKNMLMPLFAPILTAFYNLDIVDEDDIRAWHTTPTLNTRPWQANLEKCRHVGTLMIKQFDAQSSEDEDSD